jgi:hypothetical protein
MFCISRINRIEIKEKLIVRSVICILNNPSSKFQPTFFSDHTMSQPDLPELIVEEDSNEEGEGWDGEVWECNHSGTKGDVELWNVAEDSDEGGFEEETEVTECVDHALL